MNIIQIPYEQFCFKKEENFSQQQCSLLSSMPCQQEQIIPEIQRRKHVLSREGGRNSMVSIYGGSSNDSFLFDDDLPVSYDTKPTTARFTHSSCAGVGSDRNIQISAEIIGQEQVWEVQNDAFFADNQNFNIQNQLQPQGQVFEPNHQFNQNPNNQMENHFQEVEEQDEQDEQDENSIDDIDKNKKQEMFDEQIYVDQIQLNQPQDWQNGEDIDRQPSEKIQYEKDQ